MSEKTTHQKQEKSIEIAFNLTTPIVLLMILAILAPVAVAYLVWGVGSASASSPDLPTSENLRNFYLTKSTKGGAIVQATVCAAGYHMASMWEILDPTQLEYDRVNGYIDPQDMGSGPPSDGGWVRTGYFSSGANSPGEGNCSVYSTTSGYGSRAALPSDWVNGPDLHVWDVSSASCGTTARVWCVED